jgi:hypothetical protein
VAEADCLLLIRRVVVVVDIPGVVLNVVDPDGLTAEWLTEVFVAQGRLRSGSVVSCNSEPLEAMSFTGVFRRLELDYDVDAPGLPRTLIAKFSAPDPEQRATMTSMGFYAREVAFYRELAASTPVAVPICYYAAVDESDGRCVILLEDLTSARRGRSADRCSVAEVELAIDAIVPLHARWWQNPEAASRPWLNPDTNIPIDFFVETFDAQWSTFGEKLSIPITDHMRQFAELAAAELRSVLQRMFYEPPLTVIHNDYQADNLLFGRDADSPAVVVIDWQLPVRGRGTVDVAYLMSGSMDPVDRGHHESKLLRRYAAALQANAIRGYDLDRCLDDYRAALLIPPARLACAVGITPHMTPHDGAFWDVLFARQVRALVENGVVGAN